MQVFRRLLHTWPETRRRHTRRTALVLHTVGGLTEAQVGAVLGSGAVAVGDHLDEDDPLGLLGRAPDDVEVGPPPLDAIVAGSGRSRGARGRVLAGVATVVALVAAGTWSSCSTTRQPRPPPQPPRPPGRRPRPLPYLADGRLHVGALTLPVRGVTDLIDPGVGAVYRTQEADIVLVDEEGGTAEIGHNAAPGLVADPAAGLGVLADLHPAARRVRRARGPLGRDPHRPRPAGLLPLRAAARPDRRHRLLRFTGGVARLGRRRRPGHPHRPGSPGVPRPCGRPRRRPDPPRHRASSRRGRAGGCGDASALCSRARSCPRTGAGCSCSLRPRPRSSSTPGPGSRAADRAPVPLAGDHRRLHPRRRGGVRGASGAGTPPRSSSAAVRRPGARPSPPSPGG